MSNPLITDYFKLSGQKRKLEEEIKLSEEELRNLQKQLGELDQSIMDRTDKILSGPQKRGTVIND